MTLATFEPLLQKALHENGLQLETSSIQLLANYLSLLQKWNKVFNLTTITDPRDMVYLHIIDSLAVNPFLHGTRFLDVGTGAGLPGIPLAILNPEQHWTLLDKNNKKTRFLTQTIAELGLKNTTAVHERTEDFHPEQCFDSILSRAFGTLSMFVTTTAHLLCEHGSWIAMKGKHPQEEIAEIAAGFHIQDVTRLDIKGINVERHIIRLKRV